MFVRLLIVKACFTNGSRSVNFEELPRHTQTLTHFAQLLTSIYSVGWEYEDLDASKLWQSNIFILYVLLYCCHFVNSCFSYGLYTVYGLFNIYYLLLFIYFNKACQTYCYYYCAQFCLTLLAFPAWSHDKKKKNVLEKKIG